MARQIQGSQTDFSFGEIDVALKRADGHPARKAGLRQMTNSRILNTGGIQNRPGRSALYPVTNSGKRTDRLTMTAGNVFDIQFAAGRVKIINSAGATVANFTAQGNGAALPWASAADINSIVYVVSPSAVEKNIYVTFAGMRPQVISWDGVSTWSIADYSEIVAPGGQKRTPFYRITPQGITAQPSATVGNITVDFSSPIAVAGLIGTRIRYCGRQLTFTSVVSTTRMNATVNEPLPPSQTMTFTGLVGAINIGDAVLGSVSGAKGIVAATPTVQTLSFSRAGPLVSTLYHIGDAIVGGTSGATGTVTATDNVNATITVLLTTATSFVSPEVVTGPNGSASTISASGTGYIVQLLAPIGLMNIFVATEKIVGPSGSATVATAATTAPQAVTVWDDEIFNSYRGFPRSVFVDQFRVGFCNFPSVPGGIAWSAINQPFDLFVGPNPQDAMFELAPRKVQIYYVIPGPEGSEFVFCDRGIFYIPISPTNPLRPGSVQFLLLSDDGAAQVQPRSSQEAILYVNAGQNSLMAIIATGAYNRPFNTKNLSSLHNHLFNNIQAIAAPSADGTFEERYAYVLNGDGSIVVGKYDPGSLQTNLLVIGWGPWSGGGTVTWISAWAADVLFTSTYFGNGVVEILNDTQYLDCALAVNALPAAFAPPVGKGPLWFVATSQSVTLIDQVTRVMGTYQVDADGFIVPQFNGGEDLTLLSLVAGQPWTMTTEPFAPAAQSGADVKQRMNMRQFSYFAVYVINSTGFLLQQLFSAKQTTTSPPLGTAMKEHRVPAWNVGDNPILPPTQRETVESWTPPGSSYDPRGAIVKDTPGPLLIAEIAMEVSI